ncbi:acyltransferase family protein [Spirosoma migulaei]
MTVRHTSIDYMKSFLVIGMILAHSIQLLSQPKGFFWLFSTGINLITFSGFFFCFGYVFYGAYLVRKHENIRQKIAKTALKTLIGYYLSSFASSLLLTEHFTGNKYELSFASSLKVIVFLEIPWYSEFLLAFFLITVLVFLFLSFFRKLITSKVLAVGIVTFCLLVLLFLPNSLAIPYPLNLFVGDRDRLIFPVIQYMPAFLIGIYFARYKFEFQWIVFLLSLVGSGLFAFYYLKNHELPTRFLPSIYWVLGSTGILYVYFLATNWLEKRSIVIVSVLLIGMNTLFYLLISNFILFALSITLKTTPSIALGIGIFIIATIGFLTSLVQKFRLTV